MDTTRVKIDLSVFEMTDSGAEFYNNCASTLEAWETCEQGVWMLEWAEGLGVDERDLIRAAAHCANTVRHLMRDERSTRAVDAALDYADGKITRGELNAVGREARLAAMVLGHPTAAWAATHAASAAANNDYAESANGAASAMYFSVDADNRAAYVANVENQKLTADICRKYLTKSVLEIVEKHRLADEV